MKASEVKALLERADHGSRNAIGVRAREFAEELNNVTAFAETKRAALAFAKAERSRALHEALSILGEYLGGANQNEPIVVAYDRISGLKP